jgi:hypothetical protein
MVATHGAPPVPEPEIEPTVPVVLIVAEATEPSSRFLSSTVIVLELTVVVVPLTVKLPLIVADVAVRDVKEPAAGVILPIIAESISPVPFGAILLNKP